MSILYVVIASQDFNRANHKGLWIQLSEMENSNVVVANIPADYVVSVIKNKRERIREAKQLPLSYSSNLKVIRPLFFIRPEFTPKMVKNVVARQFWKAVNNAFDINSYDEIRVIIYNAFWAEILKHSDVEFKLGYYLFDEVRKNGNDDSINKKRLLEDISACSLADCIFAMSQELVDSRPEYSSKITVVGNGADLFQKEAFPKIENSVAFIGNLRSWVDKALLTEIIKLNPDYSFFFVGPIESDMKLYFDELLTDNHNVFYCGCKSKEVVAGIYTKFESVIIPYQQSDFIKATRPIKIVESVIAGTPVVTVPINGYQETEFIRFATDARSFSKEIINFSHISIDRDSEQYKNFVRENTWKTKALLISRLFEEIDDAH